MVEYASAWLRWKGAATSADWGINRKLLQSVSSKRLLDSKRDISNIVKCHLADDEPNAYIFSPPAVTVLAAHEW